MKILILEDEQNAALRMRQLVAQVQPGAEVLAVLETVKETIAWFREAERQPDIILSDIQLADGLSIDALREVKTPVPVIFTTAYDEYTLRAFKLNSIDYLLKPVDAEELKTAFDKYHSLQKPQVDMGQVLHLFQNIAAGRTSYKARFLVRQGERLITVPAGDVAYVKADDKVVFLHTGKGQKYIIDDPLDELEKVLDPAIFFRLNRTYIAPLSSISKIENHFNGRLKINLAGSDDGEIFVSRARVGAFKKWLDK